MRLVTIWQILPKPQPSAEHYFSQQLQQISLQL